jgi:hypothetical protein
MLNERKGISDEVIETVNQLYFFVLKKCLPDFGKVHYFTGGFLFKLQIKIELDNLETEEDVKNYHGAGASVSEISSANPGYKGAFLFYNKLSNAGLIIHYPLFNMKPLDFDITFILQHEIEHLYQTYRRLLNNQPLYNIDNYSNAASETKNPDQTTKSISMLLYLSTTIEQNAFVNQMYSELYDNLNNDERHSYTIKRTNTYAMIKNIFCGIYINTIKNGLTSKSDDEVNQTMRKLLGKNDNYNINKNDLFLKLSNLSNKVNKRLTKKIKMIYQRVCEDLSIEQQNIDDVFNCNNQIMNENILDEINPNEVDLSSFKKEKTLNPKIWINDKLNPKLRLRLLDIADQFWASLGITFAEPKDILLLGSIANYNWSKYSDIDLHLLVDFSEIDEKTEFVKDYFDSKKKEWNDSHPNLKFYGFPLEIYVQDINEDNASMGIYSLERNKWIIEPDPNALPSINLNKFEIKERSAKIMTLIDEICDTYAGLKDNYQLRELYKRIKTVVSYIKRIRKDGLNSDGEMSTGNLIFKVLRRTNYIDKLYNVKDKIYDKLWSINEAKQITITKKQVETMNKKRG